MKTSRRDFLKNVAGVSGLFLFSNHGYAFGAIPKDFFNNQDSFIDRLLPAPKGGGFAMKDYWIWDPSVIKGEDGRYHMFASRWSKQYGFGNWVTNSEVVRAISDTPEGPYEFVEVVLPARGKQYFDG